MIRRLNEKLVAVESGGAVNIATIYCNSTDEKPTDALANGSKLIEVDTGAEFLFDEENSEWVEVSTGGGGGSANKWYRYSGLLDGGSENQGLPFMLGGFIEQEYGEDWSQHYGDLCDDMNGNRVEMELTLTVGDARVTFNLKIGEDNRADYDNYDVWGSLCILQPSTPNTRTAGYINYNISKTNGIVLSWIWTIQDGSFVDITSYALLLPYTLDIYVHDKPSTPDEEIPYNPPED